MKYGIIGAVIVIMLFSVAAHSESPQNILILEFTLYKNDSVIFSDYYVDVGIPTVFGKVNTGYSLTVYSKEGSVLYNAFFRPGLEAMAQGASTASTGAQNAAYLRLRLPYAEKMAYLEVYHGGKMIHSQSLSDLCDHNGVCGGRENALSCPADCAKGAGRTYCNAQADGLCDPSCYAGWDPDCANNNNSAVNSSTPPAAGDMVDGTLYIALFAGIIIVALFIFRRRLVLLASFFAGKSRKT